MINKYNLKKINVLQNNDNDNNCNDVTIYCGGDRLNNCMLSNYIT